MAVGAPEWSYRWPSVPSQPALVPATVDQLPIHRESLIVEGATIGSLLLGPKQHDVILLAQDRALVATFVPHLAAALRNAHLLQQLAVQVATLGEREHELEALSTRLLTAQEEERRRIALDLHDDPLQRAILLTRKLGAPVIKGSAPDLYADAQEISASLRAICVNLHPMVIDDLGLGAGIEQLIGRVRTQADVDVTLVTDIPPCLQDWRLPFMLEVALYRVAQEALNNCLKYAEMTRIDIRLVRGVGWVRLEIADNGRGLPSVERAGDANGPALGILGMRERLHPWGGQVIVGPILDGGTVVRAEALFDESSA